MLRQLPWNLLRGMGESFTYDGFLEKLESLKQDLNPAQLSSLKIRMDLLHSFVMPTQTEAKKIKRRFAKGRLTIIDLSDPFIDPSSACGLFEIVLRLFQRVEVGTGKVLVVDEAHKVRSLLFEIQDFFFD